MYHIDGIKRRKIYHVDGINNKKRYQYGGKKKIRNVSVR